MGRGTGSAQVCSGLTRSTASKSRSASSAEWSLSMTLPFSMYVLPSSIYNLMKLTRSPQLKYVRNSLSQQNEPR